MMQTDDEARYVLNDAIARKNKPCPDPKDKCHLDPCGEQYECSYHFLNSDLRIEYARRDLEAAIQHDQQAQRDRR